MNPHINPDDMNDPCTSPAEASDLAARAEEVERTYLRTTRWDPRLRRLHRVISDLGLRVPAGWAQITDAGEVSFADLPAGTFDHLLRQLEEIADAVETVRPSTATAPAESDVPFPFFAVPTAPVTRATPSSVHLDPMG